MPRERTEMPCTFYRLTVELPCVVAFPSAIYRLTLESIAAAGRHEFIGYDHSRAIAAIIGPFYRTRELLVEAVFAAGVPVRCDTIGATIMRRMVREARAVVVATPLDDPAKRWLQSGEPLYDGAHYRLEHAQAARVEASGTGEIACVGFRARFRERPPNVFQTCPAGNNRRDLR
jgi:hypothetical protein